MARLAWVLAIVVAFTAGAVAGGLRRAEPPPPPADHDLRAAVVRLQQEIAVLQGRLGAREARLQALEQRAVTVERPRPRADGPPAVRPEQPAVTAAVLAEGARTGPRPAGPTPPPERPAAGTGVAAVPAAVPATVEAALQRFYQYLDDTGWIGGRGRQARQVIDDLRAMGDAGIEALLRVVEAGGSSNERRVAAALLGSLQEPRAVPVLQHLLENESDVLLRRAAAQSLRRLQVPESVPVMEHLLGNSAEDRFVRLSAAYGLAQLGKPQGVAGLVQIFDEATADGRGRETAFRTLASLNDERPLTFMRQLVASDAEPSYRLQAIRFVAARGDQQALDALQQVMTSPGEPASLREAAIQAYTAITHR